MKFELGHPFKFGVQIEENKLKEFFDRAENERAELVIWRTMRVIDPADFYKDGKKEEEV